MNASVRRRGGWKISSRLCALAILHGYALLVPLVPLVPFGFVKVGLLDVLFIPAVVLLLLRQSFRLHLAAVGLAGLCATALISVLWISGDVRGEAFLRAFRLLEISMPLFLAMTIRPTHEDVRRLVRSFLIGGGLSVLFGIIVFALQIPLGRVQTFRYPGGATMDRAGGIFTDSSAYGHLVATWFVVGVASLPAIVTRSSWRAFAVLLVIFSGGAFALYGSISRSAFLGTLISAAVGTALPIPAAWRRAHRLLGARLVVSAVAALAAVATFLPAKVERLGNFLWHRLVIGTFGSLLNPGQADRITSGRIGNWVSYLPHFTENPLTGIGYKALILERGVPPDNQYLSILVELGLVGLFFFFIFLYGLFASALFAYARGNQFAWMLLVTWSGQLAMMIAIDTITFWGSMPALLAITGLALNWECAKSRRVAYSLRPKEER